MKKRKKPDWKGTWTWRSIAIPTFLLFCVILIAVCFYVPGFIANGNSAAEPEIEISEVMAANESACPAPDGNYYPWVELRNRTDKTVSLDGWKLGETYDIRGAKTLPSVSLWPDERIVLYLTDTASEDFTTADLQLSKNGDELYLFDESGALVQLLTVPSMGKNKSVIPDEETGEWVVTDLYTPGEENTADGYQRVLDKLTAEETVYVNEVVASNRTTVVDETGDSPDWIELYNPSDQETDLSGWTLTKDLSDRREYVFPEGTVIAPGGYLLVYAEEGERNDALCTGFSLPASEGSVYLLNRLSECVSTMNWNKLDHDISCQRLNTGKTSTEYTATPGGENAQELVVDTEEAERDEEARQLSSNDEELYINEVVCSMKNGSDWIELHNASNASIDLSGWWLSDKKTEPEMWAFPSGTNIQAGGYLVIWLNGEDEAPDYQTTGVRSTLSLSLSDTQTDTENILLSKPDGTLVDRIRMKDQYRDVSYGRAEGYDTYRYFKEMTPGTVNSMTSYASCAGTVEFLPEGGAHAEEQLMLELRVNDNSVIYYTTDGSEPTSSSKVYDQPITLKGSAVIRAISAGEDMLPSEAVTHTYILGYSTTLRVVCVTGKGSSLTGSGGVLNTGKKTETAVNVEIYDYDGTLMINQGCELQLSGRGSRANMAQKAFKLKAKAAYGAGKFKAKLFTNRDYTEYDSIVMRASGQDVFKSHMRDSILTSLAADTSVMYQETELCAVFINGQYWGMYNMRENLNEDSICQYEGWEGDNDDLDIVAGSSMSRKQGSSDGYHALIKFVKNNDMSDDANVETLGQYMDIDNYIDYACLMIYVDHEDMGNTMMYRNPNKDGKWRSAMFDQDLSYLNDKNSMNMWLSSSGSIGSITEYDNSLFYHLMKNASFKDKFLTRMGQLMATTFSSANVQSKIMERYEAIKDEMVNSCKRWDVAYSTFQKQVKKIYNYAGTRTYKLLGYIQDAMDLTDAQMQQYFGDAIANESATAASATDETDEDDEAA